MKTEVKPRVRVDPETCRVVGWTKRDEVREAVRRAQDAAANARKIINEIQQRMEQMA